jgi:hypothetical protein
MTWTPLVLSLPSRPDVATARRRIKVITALSVGLGSASLTTGVFAAMGPIALCTALSTALMSAWLITRCLRPSSDSGIMRDNISGRVVGWGAAAGALNAYPSFLLTAFALSVTEANESSFGSGELGTLIIATGVIGLIIGTPLGLLFSATYLVPARLADELSVNGAIEGWASLLRTSGCWLIVVALGSALFGWAVGIQSCGGAFHDSSSSLEVYGPLILVCGVTLITGVITMAIGISHKRRLQRWFTQVEAGQLPGWNIVRISEIKTDPSELVPLFHSMDSMMAVLMREVKDHRNGAYRTGVEIQPWALVPLPERLEGCSNVL